MTANSSAGALIDQVRSSCRNVDSGRGALPENILKFEHRGSDARPGSRLTYPWELLSSIEIAAAPAFGGNIIYGV